MALATTLDRDICLSTREFTFQSGDLDLRGSQLSLEGDILRFFLVEELLELFLYGVIIFACLRCRRCLECLANIRTCANCISAIIPSQCERVEQENVPGLFGFFTRLFPPPTSPLTSPSPASAASAAFWARLASRSRNFWCAR